MLEDNGAAAAEVRFEQALWRFSSLVDAVELPRHKGAPSIKAVAAAKYAKAQDLRQGMLMSNGRLLELQALLSAEAGHRREAVRLLHESQRCFATGRDALSAGRSGMRTIMMQGGVPSRWRNDALSRLLIKAEWKATGYDPMLAPKLHTGREVPRNAAECTSTATASTTPGFLQPPRPGKHSTASSGGAAPASAASGPSPNTYGPGALFASLAAGGAADRDRDSLSSGMMPTSRGATPRAVGDLPGLATAFASGGGHGASLVTTPRDSGSDVGPGAFHSEGAQTASLLPSAAKPARPKRVKMQAKFNKDELEEKLAKLKEMLRSKGVVDVNKAIRVTPENGGEQFVVKVSFRPAADPVAGAAGAGASGGGVDSAAGVGAGGGDNDTASTGSLEAGSQN